MEVDSLVDYSDVTSRDRFDPYVGSQSRWAASAVIPEEDTGGGFEPRPSYTVDDVVAHNNLLGRRDWFKYGRRVYSLVKMEEAIQNSTNGIDIVDPSDGKEIGFDDVKDRSDDVVDTDDENDVALEVTETRAKYLSALNRGYPIYKLKKAGISRLMLKQLLDQSFVGVMVEQETFTVLVRFKGWVEDTLEGVNQTEKTTRLSAAMTDLRDQLCRWLKDYPCVERARYSPPVNCVDHNDNFFPLPTIIMCNPLVLREWTDEWKPFDCTIPEGGVWDVKELLNEVLGDTHEVFVDFIKSRVDSSIEDFDTDIDGEAAWDVIEEDIVKNDKTTAEQDRILEARRQNKHLGDSDWMRKQRRQIASKLAKRHKWNRNKIEPYLAMCDRLEQGWGVFQELCCLP